MPRDFTPIFQGITLLSIIAGLTLAGFMFLVKDIGGDSQRTGALVVVAVAIGYTLIAAACLVWSKSSANLIIVPPAIMLIAVISYFSITTVKSGMKKQQAVQKMELVTRDFSCSGYFINAGTIFGDYPNTYREMVAYLPDGSTAQVGMAWGPYFPNLSYNLSTWPAVITQQSLEACARYDGKKISEVYQIKPYTEFQAFLRELR